LLCLLYHLQGYPVLNASSRVKAFEFSVDFDAFVWIELVDFNKVMPAIREYTAAGAESGEHGGDAFSTGTGAPDDIFGDESIAELGNEKVNVDIILASSTVSGAAIEQIYLANLKIDGKKKSISQGIANEIKNRAGV